MRVQHLTSIPQIEMGTDFISVKMQLETVIIDMGFVTRSSFLSRALKMLRHSSLVGWTMSQSNWRQYSLQ